MWTMKSSLAAGGGVFLSVLVLSLIFGSGPARPTSRPCIFDPSSFAQLSDRELEATGALLTTPREIETKWSGRLSMS